MKYSRGVFLLLLAVLFIACPLSAQRKKIIVDQDARGPASTDLSSIALFL